MELVSVTKFAYLKELLEPKVKADIDGFPLNTEGYERAKKHDNNSNYNNNNKKKKKKKRKYLRIYIAQFSRRDDQLRITTTHRIKITK